MGGVRASNGNPSGGMTNCSKSSDMGKGKNVTYAENRPAFSGKKRAVGCGTRRGVSSSARPDWGLKWGKKWRKRVLLTNFGEGETLKKRGRVCLPRRVTHPEGHSGGIKGRIVNPTELKKDVPDSNAAVSLFKLSRPPKGAFDPKKSKSSVRKEGKAGKTSDDAGKRGLEDLALDGLGKDIHGGL